MTHKLSDVLSGTIRHLEPAAAITVEVGTSLGTAILAMREHHIGCVLVTKLGVLEGILTERDILMEVVGSVVDLESTPVDSFMTRAPEALRMEDPVAYALNRMSIGGFRHVPLVDELGRPTGIISVRDVVDAIVAYFPTKILNLPAEANSFPAAREGA